MLSRWLSILTLGSSMSPLLAATAEPADSGPDRPAAAVPCREKTSEVEAEPDPSRCGSQTDTGFNPVIVTARRPDEPVVTYTAPQLGIEQGETIRDLLRRILTIDPDDTSSQPDRRSFQSEDEDVLTGTIRVDGLRLGLDESDLAETLDFLPASLVGRLEIRHPDEGNGGRPYVNLILRERSQDVSTRLSGELRRLGNSKIVSDMRGTIVVALDTPAAGFRTGLDLRHRQRDRSRDETSRRRSPDGKLLAARTLTEDRTGTRTRARLTASGDWRNGRKAQAVLEYETEDTEETARNSASRITERQFLESENLSGLLEYTRSEGDRRRVGVTVLFDEATEDRRLNRDKDASDGAIDFGASDRRVFGRARYAWFPESGRRWRLELDVDRQTRTIRLGGDTGRASTNGVRAAELRIEPGISYRRRFGERTIASLKVELEANRLETRTQMISQDRWFADLKPTATLGGEWRDMDWNAWLSRSVTQIALEDFTTNFDEIDMELQAGNPDIRPQKTWEVGASLDRKLDAVDGAMNLRLTLSEISDLIDFIAGPNDATLKGNLGFGQSAKLSTDLRFSLSRLGLGDGRARLSYDWLSTSVFDPKIGAHRNFSETPTHRLEARYARDIAGLGAEFSLAARSQSRLLSVEADRIDEETQSTPEIDLALEWRLSNIERLTLKLGNVLDTEEVRLRTRYRGAIASGDIRRLEERIRAAGRYLAINLRTSF